MDSSRIRIKSSSTTILPKQIQYSPEPVISRKNKPNSQTESTKITNSKYTTDKNEIVQV